jgi:hypothetical protein
MFFDDFCACIFSMVEKSWWNLSPCLSLTAPRFGGKKPKWVCKKWIYSDILHPTHWYACNKSSTGSLAFTFPRKFRQTALNSYDADFSFSVSRCWGRPSLIISRIWGLIKMPPFNLASLSFGNFSLKYSKPLPCLFINLTKFFINANFLCSGGNKIFSLPNSGRFLTHISPGTGFSHVDQAFIF